MVFGSVCSGIEAASVAWKPLGWRPLALAEIESFPSAVLAHHYPDVPNVGDMTMHDWSQYRGQCDVVVGGPPCQAFSVAGLRKSLDDDRGNLSLQYMRAVHAIDPFWCVTENVPGWLSTKDNAFGCFLAGMVGEDAELVPPGGRWTDAGVVTGPERTAAWRILDAQYFGLAQRRRRVFVLSVRGSGNWRCAAALFPVGQSLSWNPAPRRETGQGFAASTAPSLTASGRGVGRTGGSRGQDPMVAVAFGGNNTAGPIDVATAVNAHGGPHGRQDFESETFIAHTLRAEGFDASEDGTGRGVPLVPTARAIAFSSKDHGADVGEVSPTLRAMGHSGSHANAGGQVAVAFDLRGREGGAAFEGPHDTANIRAASGGSSRSYVAASSVRRLTPRECERLQGFPDDYTLVTVRGRPAADGPRYKALGNSMAVPVMAWIGRRIELVERLTAESEAA